MVSPWELALFAWELLTSWEAWGEALVAWELPAQRGTVLVPWWLGLFALGLALLTGVLMGTNQVIFPSIFVITC